ncbi:ADP-ribose pyrophosphatase, mitochondrial-like [Saccoglossus kowalevskii]|uniref:ADP-ribose pyrophosphatase, mitochondrial-like n=1 Tax=Saccoglossus kowalevskii TaxID=10224 RepID=A0ABM0MH45_SACKO|nr:PREDICTED: ADP-ribose pyrophosphatase, mitochondrial-like [Saccoglossus kowalevskii]
MSLHVKSREKVYPGSGGIERAYVPDDKVSWDCEWTDYSPTNYTAPIVAEHPVWADPDIMGKPDHNLKFNERDGNINRVSHMPKPYEVIDGFPRNPCGRTGMIGRGFLGKWGPNHAADPIVTRWKRNANGDVICNQTTNKQILQFVAIKRKDTGDWAIPGGMVDAGDTVSATLKREFGEEAMNSLEAPEEERNTIEKAVANLFRCGTEVYRGYVDDPRNTDNAWMETVAVNFHDAKGTSVGKFKLHAGDDAGDVQWADISGNISLYASHELFISKTAEILKAHW